MKRKKQLSLLAILLAFCLVFTGCGAAKGEDSAWGGEMAPSEPMMKPEAEMPEALVPGGRPMPDGNKGGMVPEQNEGVFERKLIKNANFTLETLDYDAAVERVQRIADEMGGYVQYSSVSGSGPVEQNRYRTASFTLRIPADKLEGFGSRLAECGSIVSSNEYVEEVTDTYYDVTARLETLRIQEERLLAILEKADKLDQVIELERALADVRYQIESAQGRLRRLDDQIAMSRVEVSIREVYNYTPVQQQPKSLGERIRQNFVRGIEEFRCGAEDFIVWMAGNLLTVALWIVIAVLLILAVHKTKRRRKLKKAAKKEESKPAEPEQSESKK